jgi:hypothetical protein
LHRTANRLPDKERFTAAVIFYKNENQRQNKLTTCIGINNA